MTQEDKAKRYDELLLKLQKAKVDDNVCDEMYYRVIDDIVPELKESEDEKILRHLKAVVKEYDMWTERGLSMNDVLAWLEKQREQKQDPCDNCKDVMLNCHNFPCIKKKAFKQGKSVLEAINEEKVDNANKVEPKFKDGDVLNSSSHHLIWIYKDNEHYYACVNMNYVTENVDTDGLINIPSDVRPATKEQREQLEKAMTDAGYTFDFDKKELKKIEQKSAWSEDDKNILDAITYTVKNSGYKHCIGVSNEMMITFIKSLKDRVQPRQKQEWVEEDEKMFNVVHKSAWSEDDEKGLSDALWCCKQAASIAKDENDMGNAWYAEHWLKTLKERYTWKPSDKQINAIRLARSFVTDDFVSDTLVELEKQLKKLK